MVTLYVFRLKTRACDVTFVISAREQKTRNRACDVYIAHNIIYSRLSVTQVQGGKKMSTY